MRRSVPVRRGKEGRQGHQRQHAKYPNFAQVEIAAKRDQRRKELKIPGGGPHPILCMHAYPLQTIRVRLGMGSKSAVNAALEFPSQFVQIV